MPGTAASDDSLDALRRRAVGVGYRMLGSVADAEDVAQEALLRYHGALAGGERVESPRGFVTTVATRLALDELRSARRRRVAYYGTWLPEPLLTGGVEEATRRVETAEALSLPLLFLLERLSPLERAVFVLREAFAYDYEEVAAVVGKTATNCRQIHSRARRRLASGGARFEADPAEREELAARFFAAVEGGELGELEALLAPDATFVGDGGLAGRGIKAPVTGRRAVHRLLLGFLPEHRRMVGGVRAVEVNGGPAVLFTDAEGRVVSVVTLDIGPEGIRTLLSVINPDKLQHLGLPVSPLIAGPLRPRLRDARSRVG